MKINLRKLCFDLQYFTEILKNQNIVNVYAARQSTIKLFPRHNHIIKIDSYQGDDGSETALWRHIL